MSAFDNGRPPLVSHFSWTTIATSAAPTPMEDFEDATALPPMPSASLEKSYFSDRPNESLLSRKRPIQRHQLVYAALGDRMREEIHALSMKTLTPEEFQT